MSLARMSWHIGDYLRDTGHLRAIEHGAYFLLCMHYYAKGGLPDDDRQLATIARMTDREWKEHKSVLQGFFHDGWRHKRADKEIEEANARYQRRASAGSKGGVAKSKQCSSNATDDPGNLLEQPTTSNLQPPTEFKTKTDLFDGEGRGEDQQRRPPRHGTFSRKHDTVFIRAGTDEWAAYAADFKLNRGVTPIPNRDGGFWFCTNGEATRRPRRKVA